MFFKKPKSKIIKHQISIEGIMVEITQRRMRNLRLQVVSGSAKVKASGPLRVSLKQIENFIKERIDWIKKQRQEILSKKLPAKNFIDGEEHEFLGERFFLKIREAKTKNRARFIGNIIEMHLTADSTLEQKRKLMDDLWRKRLKEIIPLYIAELEKIMNVRVKEFGVKKMKTRWGTCNPRAQRIWLNLELVKFPPKCLEFIIIHEMVHLLERNHNKKFFAYMDQFMPDWKTHKKALSHLALD
jgi:hypothetical protein